ncbi:MAG: SRPBCC family protein [Proteobacteria bacterium]|nr:SRPBCC family protein [Pseudomonadota bacterium]
MRLLRLACLFLVLSAAAAQAAEDLSVEANRKGPYVEVRARATIDAPLSVIWTTLTDYERLPEFVPGLKKSRVTSRNGPVAIVEQSGEARFLMFTFPIDVTLEAVEKPPSSLRVRVLSGTLRYLEGGYSVEPDPHSARFILHWIGTIAPDVSLPPLFGEVVMRMSIEDQFTGMVGEIDRREALRRAAEAEARRK